MLLCASTHRESAPAAAVVPRPLPAGVALLALAQEGLGQGAWGGSEVEHGRHRLDQLVGLWLQGAKALQLLGHVLDG